MIFHVLKNREAYREEMMQSNDSATTKLATAMKNYAREYRRL